MTKLIDRTLLTELCQKAKDSERGRAHHNLHETAEDPVQRLLIALQPGTYVPVHRHNMPGRWELLTLLQGSLACILFDSDGNVIDRQLFNSSNGAGMEFSQGTWHTVVCLDADTVIQEVKPGPFDPATASEVASWCPKEGSDLASGFSDWVMEAQIGDRFRG